MFPLRNNLLYGNFWKILEKLWKISQNLYKICTQILKTLQKFLEINLNKTK